MLIKICSNAIGRIMTCSGKMHLGQDRKVHGNLWMPIFRMFLFVYFYVYLFVIVYFAAMQLAES